MHPFQIMHPLFDILRDAKSGKQNNSSHTNGWLGDAVVDSQIMQPRQIPHSFMGGCKVLD